MKFSVCIFLVFSLALVSCTKEDSPDGMDGMVKLVDSIVMDAHIGLVSLEHGDFIVVSNNQLVKLNNVGNISWRKPITELLETRAAVAEPGAGFVLFGVPVHSPTPASYYACRYDADGNLLETKQVNINFPLPYAALPVSMIRLSNGNFAITMISTYSWCSHLKILDHDFNLVQSTVFPILPGYDNFMIQNICEVPGGDIAMAASITHSYFDSSWANAAYILAGQDGTIKSISILGDKVLSLAANSVSPCAGGFFSASSTMTGWDSGKGTFVSYYGGTQIAGSMQIDRFNSQGQFTGSRILSGYPGYGVIKSIRPTPDGGYLLCGTAGNSGSSVTVSRTKVYVCKLDADLNQQWSKVFATPYQAIGTDAVPTSGGGYLVTGNMKSFNLEYQMLMIHTNANGDY